MSKFFKSEEILNALKTCGGDKSDKCAECAFSPYDEKDCSCVNKLHKSAYGLVKTMQSYINCEKIEGE